MNCPACGDSAVAIAVPPSLREYAPEEADSVAVCPRCLTVASAAGESTSDPATVHDAFPAGEPGVAAALLVGLLESVAHNRSAIESLVDRLEREGVDPLSLLDRLERDPDLEPAVDLGRRRHQLVQLL